ncbi:hypothetical protein M408DRAFT_22567 [Serendipita vermifera MAFF 305830]|uniref:Uncharacterized protein n=1 Tax=Serendipita vermifera MAFF 305830 TaxID=933852 RepID=A0A0C2XKZ8_SERVB|nr:hypothetical protein M408DRAFT_22567 [Serendipita vermifera MAFF 305830]
MSIPISVHVLSDGAAYLWNPPNDSWICSFANFFFILGIIVASPMLFLLALDITSYAIVRTLGIENAHPASSKANLRIITPSTPSTSSTPSPVEGATPSQKSTLLTVVNTQSTTLKHRPKSISIPTNQSLSIEQAMQPFFTTPGGHSAHPNLELAGLFSPPESRTPSPPGDDLKSGGTDSYLHLDHHRANAANEELDEGPTPRAEAQNNALSPPYPRVRVQGTDDANADGGPDGVASANNKDDQHVLLRRRNKTGPTRNLD